MSKPSVHLRMSISNQSTDFNGALPYWSPTSFTQERIVLNLSTSAKNVVWLDILHGRQPHSPRRELGLYRNGLRWSHGYGNHLELGVSVYEEQVETIVPWSGHAVIACL